MVREPPATDISTRNEESVMTKRIAGGCQVGGGFYWNLKNWEIVPVNGKSGTLPGTEQDAYVAVPSLAMLALAPAMGALLVIFLPFVGVALAVHALGQKSLKDAAPALRRLRTPAPEKAKASPRA
jgi:hypothetical protein